jgi:hypothetical protein
MPGRRLDFLSIHPSIHWWLLLFAIGHNWGHWHPLPSPPISRPNSLAKMSSIPGNSCPNGVGCVITISFASSHQPIHALFSTHIFLPFCGRQPSHGWQQQEEGNELADGTYKLIESGGTGGELVGHPSGKDWEGRACWQNAL